MLKTAFCTRRRRERSIELFISARREASRASEGWMSLIEVMILFIWWMSESTILEVKEARFWEASLRRMARVAERH